MVDETEFRTMDADDCRSDRFECDECDALSTIKWCGEINDECAEALATEGWVYFDGNVLCPDCSKSTALR